MNIKKTINSENQLENILSKNDAVLLYFKTNSCNVGEAVEPKINELFSTQFPRIECYSVDMNMNPTITAKYSAFVEPTIIVFFDGKETVKRSRTFSITEIEKIVRRPYSLIFRE